MTKQLFLAVGCLALLTMFTSAAMADTLTFTYTHDPGGNGVLINTAYSQGSADDVSVKNSVGTVVTLPGGRAGISAENGIYTASSTMVTATFASTGNPGIVDITVTGGVGGICGVCLQGVLNTGTYIGFQGEVGQFAGIFHPTFISSALLAAFGDAGQHLLPVGADASTTIVNNIIPPMGTTPGRTQALLGSGSISVQTTAVPEPASLALLGTAVLGVAGRIRRKR